MAYRPRHTRRDKNQQQIIDELRELGAVVWDLADHGGEVLDLLVFWRGECRPVEVKRPGHETELTKGELESILDVGRVGVDAIIASCTEDVIAKWEE